MLVRRLAEAPVEGLHQIDLRVLMDAGEMGSRNLSATWLDVPAGSSEDLRTHEESEQLYIAVRGIGTISVAGDTEQLEQGDVVLVPQATDHTVANEGPEAFGCVSIQSPPVSVEELYLSDLAAGVVGAEEYEDYA